MSHIVVRRMIAAVAAPPRKPSSTPSSRTSTREHRNSQLPRCRLTRTVAATRYHLTIGAVNCQAGFAFRDYLSQDAPTVSRSEVWMGPGQPTLQLSLDVIMYENYDSCESSKDLRGYAAV